MSGLLGIPAPKFVLWVQIAGVVFPVPILLMIPIREFILPRLFGRKNLAALDPAPYEDEEGCPLRSEATGSREASVGMEGGGSVDALGVPAVELTAT
jgi:hypothetical protein